MLEEAHGCEPHPATYILFRPLQAQRDEGSKNDQTATAPRNLNYKKSCPALLGTASRRLDRIKEHTPEGSMSVGAAQNAQSSLTRTLHDSNIHGADHSTTISTTTKLGKKRSFLLVDVLETVEGCPPLKRREAPRTHCDLANDEKSSTQDINNSSSGVASQVEGRFPLLDSQDRSNSETVSRAAIRNPEMKPSTDRPKSDELTSDSGSFTRFERSRGRLRNQKSMIEISLECGRSSAPLRSRLETMNTDRITSFDSILQSSRNCKTTTADVKLDTDSVGTSAAEHPTEIKHDMPNEKVTTVQFSRATELLRQIPDPLEPARKRRLRHAKSARDILHQYTRDKITSDSNQRCLMPLGDVHNVDSGTTSTKRTKEASLRDNLRSLLGRKKHGS